MEFFSQRVIINQAPAAKETPRGQGSWVAIAAAIASAVAALMSAITAHGALALQNDQEVSARLSDYVRIYAQFEGDNRDVLDDPAQFQRLRSKQAGAIITGGMLVSVVEAMHRAGDPRAPEWACFLHAVSGPLSIENGLDDYAYSTFGHEAVRRARKDDETLGRQAYTCRDGNYVPISKDVQS